MGLQLKINRGTPKSGKSLCGTCKHAVRIVGQECQEFFRCERGLFSPRHIVPFKISECGGYYPTNTPLLHEMKEIAWTIEARRRGPSGFKGPEEEQMEIVITKPKSFNNSTPEKSI